MWHGLGKIIVATGFEKLPNLVTLTITQQLTNIWASFVRNFVAKSFWKYSNLVTLLGSHPQRSFAYENLPM